MKVVHAFRKEGILCMGVYFRPTTLSRTVEGYQTPLLNFPPKGRAGNCMEAFDPEGINILVLASALRMGVLIEVNKIYMKK